MIINSKTYITGDVRPEKSKIIEDNFSSLNEQDMQELFTQLPLYTKLEFLSLKDTKLNKMRFTNLNKLIKIILSLPNLRKLDLSDNNLDRLQISAIIDALEEKYNKLIFNRLSINLSSSTIDSVCKSKLAKLIHKGIEVVTDEYSPSNAASPAAAMTYKYAGAKSNIEPQDQRTSAPAVAVCKC